jgi:hypothetical protein
MTRSPKKLIVRSIDLFLGRLRMVVARHPLSASINNEKDTNKRTSFFDDGGDLAPGQLYSTESGR